MDGGKSRDETSVVCRVPSEDEGRQGDDTQEREGGIGGVARLDVEADIVRPK